MTPRVAILMETSLEVSRNMLRGIIRYIREHETWTLDLTPGGIADQRLPDNWNGNGIIARIPSVKEAARLGSTHMNRRRFKGRRQKAALQFPRESHGGGVRRPVGLDRRRRDLAAHLEAVAYDPPADVPPRLPLAQHRRIG